MGREATCHARVGDESAEVKALLESTELILRGAIKRRYAIAALAQVQAAAGELRFEANGEAVALALGDTESQRWATKIATPPPSLASKLGVGPAQPAFVLGRVDDAALTEALRGARTDDAAAAHSVVAVVRSDTELAATLEAHAALPCPGLWIVHPKGRGASIGDSAIRQVLRERGYVDHKTSGVSEALTATRYVRR
jgi:hypothetical protein